MLSVFFNSFLVFHERKYIWTTKDVGQKSLAMLPALEYLKHVMAKTKNSLNSAIEKVNETHISVPLKLLDDLFNNLELAM